jgi:low affinity Fe/Cu permease
MRAHPAAPDRSTIGTRMISSATQWLGSIPVITGAALLMLAWAIGLFFVPDGVNNQIYALALNSVTAAVTFIMVFIIQSSQNRDTRAVQAKLDAQSRSLSALSDRVGADHDSRELQEMLGLEDAPEREIQSKQASVRSGVPRA